AHLKILDRKALWQLIVNPDLHFGDLYSAGRLQVRGDLLTLLLEAYRYTAENTFLGQIVARGSRLAPDLADSKRNIHHHYDIGNEFYRLWLDREALQYRSEEHTSELQSRENLVCRLLLEKKKKSSISALELVSSVGSAAGRT